METEDEEVAVGVDSGLCFKDDQRICNASCMAYLTFPKESQELNEQQQHCALLAFEERKARHLVIIAKLLADKNTAGRKAAADMKREAANPVNPAIPLTSPFPKPPEGL